MTNITQLTLTSAVPTGPAGAATTATIDALFGAGASVEVVPTVTAGSYTAGYVIGGIMTFASVLAPNSFGGILESLTLKFKGSAQTTAFSVALFDTSPIGTFADHGAPVINAADTAHLLGIWQLASGLSPLGTHTVYELDGIGKQIIGASQSLYAVVTTTSIITPASSSDMSLKVAVVW